MGTRPLTILNGQHIFFDLPFGMNRQELTWHRGTVANRLEAASAIGGDKDPSGAGNVLFPRRGGTFT
jgi:hypothetical protein